VARVAPRDVGLYGRDAYQASRIDGFLDASLVFAREAQVYLLELGARRAGLRHTSARAKRATPISAASIRPWLRSGATSSEDDLTLADIVFATELALFSAERAHEEKREEAGLTALYDGLRAPFPRAWQHFTRLCAHDAFAAELGPYLEKLGGRPE
jgi:elongation factor 1-gamma